MDALNYFEKIEAYQEGTMSPLERKKFESELASNSALREEYDAYRATQKALEVLAFQNLDTSPATPAPPEVPVKKIKSRRSYWAIAAGILFIVFAGIWWTQLRVTNEKLVSQFYEIPNISPDRGSADAVTYNDAVNQFYEKKYQASIDYFSSIPTSDTAYLEAQLVLGHSYLKLGRSDQAITAFSQVSQQPGDHQLDARWHLLLAHLQKGEEAIARQQLTFFLNDPSSDYHAEAIALQDQLNSFWR